MGRKSKYNDKDAAEIVSRLSKGEPLTIICRDDWLPCDDTVRNWADNNPEFARDIASARVRGFDAIALECLSIADSPNQTVNPETLEIEVRDTQRDRLRVETRLKLLAKWDPKRYGDKVALVGGDPESGDKPVQMDVSNLTDEQLRALASIPVR